MSMTSIGFSSSVHSSKGLSTNLTLVTAKTTICVIKPKISGSPTLAGEGSSKNSPNAGRNPEPFVINNALGSIALILNDLSRDVVTSPSRYLRLIKLSLSIKFVVLFSFIYFSPFK